MPDIRIEVAPGTSRLLLTAGKMCNDDIVISAPAGKASGPAPVVKTDPNAFTFELDPGGSKRLLTAGKYCERNIMVTATGEKPAVTLDIADGPIVITDTGYTQGDGAEILWGDNAAHELTITQSDPETPVSNYIEVQSGTVEITLQGVNLTNSSRSPFKVSGNGTEATVVLEDGNTLESTFANCAALEIGRNTTVNIKVPEGKSDEYGTLNATGGTESAAIGASQSGNAGTLKIYSGTVSATHTGNRASGIGPSRTRDMTAIYIYGGDITNRGHAFLGKGSTDRQICDTIVIAGGYVDTNGVQGENLTVSGGTIVTSTKPGLIGTSSLTITGGNIGDAYTGDIPGRTRTKLSFVTADGSPIVDTEVFVSEGDNEWSALTDEDGVVYTYLDAGTSLIRAGVSYDRKIDVSIAGGEGTFVG